MKFYVSNKELIDKIKYDEDLELYEIPEGIITEALEDSVSEDCDPDMLGKYLNKFLKKFYDGAYKQEMCLSLLTKIISNDSDEFSEEGAAILKLAKKILSNNIKYNSRW